MDLRQAYESWRDASRLASHRFSGSMFWRQVNGTDYLKRKIGRSEKSLGHRSPETENIYQSFHDGRKVAKERLRNLTNTIDIQAGIARSVGLGRVPRLIGRLLRLLDQAEILGHIRVVGTNSMFAYEALAGVHLSGEVLATSDIDLLVDARRRLRIIMDGPREKTVLGLLQSLDHSFENVQGKPYRAVNAEGFMVDLIRPQSRPPWKDEPGSLGLSGSDISPSPIEGLQWLVNCEATSTLVIDTRGYPAPIIVPDPRIWMLHKMWLSKRLMREPEKKRRDGEQALIMWRLIKETLPQYVLDDAFVAGLPKPLRESFATMQPAPTSGSPTLEDRPGDDGWEPPQPGW